MNNMLRMIDTVTSADGLMMVPGFLIGSMAFSLGADILCDQFGRKRLPIMDFSWKVSSIVLGVFLIRYSIEMFTGPFGAKSRVLSALEKLADDKAASTMRPTAVDVMAAAITYWYPIPDKMVADHVLSPEQEVLRNFLAKQPGDFTYHIVREYTDNTEDEVLFTVGVGKRRAAVVWTEALSRLIAQKYNI